MMRKYSGVAAVCAKAAVVDKAHTVPRLSSKDFMTVSKRFLRIVNIRIYAYIRL
jgi:hypothetical protein